MNVTLVGLGPGNPESMTREAWEALAAADVIIGSERLVSELPPAVSARRIAQALPDKVAELVAANAGWRNVCVVLSGDVGFYSGAKALRRLLAAHNPRVVCGISTPQYFAARLGISWEDARLVSAHGLRCDALAEVLNHRSVIFLTGGDQGPAEILRSLCERGLDDAAAAVGENLSYPGERIVKGAAGGLCGQTFAPISVLWVANHRTFALPPCAGIEDAAFIRGGAPMTKREVRAMALSLLRPYPESVCYDIGAGTGSVAVEMSLAARRGRVYAVETADAACGLIAANRLKFGAYNMIPVHGAAPGALAALPKPDVAFIGGSKGNMDAIVGTLLEKNRDIRLVASAASVETLRQATDSMHGRGIPRVEVSQIMASRTVRRGDYDMFEGQNPVFLISGGGSDGD